MGADAPARQHAKRCSGSGRDDDDWPRLARRLRLTARQAQVLRGTCDGLTYHQIGLQLGGLSAATIDSHWRQIKAKLRLASHNQAIRLVADGLAEYRIERESARLAAEMTRKAVRQAVEQAVEHAVAEVTEHFRGAIADRDRTIAELEERVSTLSGTAATRSKASHEA
jgi:DNA-binding CsgD family transcriptional regulator